MSAASWVRSLLFCLVAVSTGMSAGAAWAAFPAQTIKIMVGFSPGPGADYITRLIARNMEQNLHATVVVENRAGANGLVATTALSQAAPDGYTLFMTSIGHVVNPAIYSSADYDPLGGFTPIGMVVRFPNVLVVGKGSPFETIAGLVDHARKYPGKLTFGSSGYGSSSHLAGELLKQSAGINIEHVPYSTSQPYPDVAAGRVSMVAPPYVSALSLIKADKVRALAVTSSERSVGMPDIPTVKEGGIADYDLNVWYVLLAPAGLPTDIQKTLNASLNAVLADPALADRLRDQGGTLMPGSAAQATDFMAKEQTKWSRVIQEAGIAKMK